MAGLPRTLRKFNTFNEGRSFIGECLELKLPKLAIKTDDYQGAGMMGSVALIKGIDKLELEHTYNSPISEIVASFGAERHDAAQFRWMGSYADEQTGESQAVEISVRGRHNELDLGDAKAGEGGQFKVMTHCSYFKLSVRGENWIEIDIVNDIFVVMGVDRMAQHRKNVGL
jgi:P2 family phage contractile tail tube protein